MTSVFIRPAVKGDLPRLTEIYNHYVLTTPVTFDLRPFTVEERSHWFNEHSDQGRHRLIVAEDQERAIAGYASTGRFRPKEAYLTTVESSIYCAPGASGQGIGTKLYDALFKSIQDEDIQRIVAGITQPNAASVALHERFGFHRIGTFSDNGRKFGRYWDVAWFERPLRR